MHRALLLLAVVPLLTGCAESALADDASSASDTASDSRPSIMFYRWQEDWSALANPEVRTEPGDDLKYIPLSDDDPKRYLSLGITLRERYENNDAPLFGTTGKTDLSYVLHRLEVHADAHVGDATRIFVQVENALAPGLARPGPADANKLDLRLAFIDSSFRIDDGIFKYRLGRQEIAFDLQRFVSARDGPNVRQAFDAIWTDYERGDWRVSGFASQPVQYRNETAFDDFSNRHLTYGGARIQRRNLAGGDLSLTFSEYRNDNAHFLAGSGEEHRRNVDVHYTGAARGFDWDVEGMHQQGSIAGKTVSAWALGNLFGYTVHALPWQPRLGLQLDAASGDRNLSDQRIGTFNPLFPNGYYETLSGYTGFTNFIHLKPSLTLTPAKGFKLIAAVGELWRQTTHDAVYVQPDIPVPGTAGEPGRRSSTYGELRLDWTVTRSFALALETERYVVAPAIVHAGGHDSDYVGVEARWGW
jgi:hypothetical protein